MAARGPGSVVALGAAALLAASASATSASDFPGKIYSVATNGTTNQLNFLVADLQTFEVFPLGPAFDGDVLGSAALVTSDQVFWFCHLALSPEAILLTGIDTATGNIKYAYDTATWAAGHVFITGIFEGDVPGMLRVFGEDPKLGTSFFFHVSASNGSAVLEGSLDASTPTGYDPAWDPAGRRAFFYLGDGNDEDSGSLRVFDLSSPAQPRLAGAIPLQQHYSLPQWDAATSSLLGFTVQAQPDGSYVRNVTQLFVADSGRGGQYNATARGSTGTFWVIFDGPKAFDAATRRIFALLATSPMGEMDLVALVVPLDGGPATVAEAPGICGFIGYCPQAIAYGLT